MSLRCSICDKKTSRWIYRNWHCQECEEIITKTIGTKVIDKDNEEYLLDDDAQEFLEGST